MAEIEQDLELTTELGCFNCAKFKNCRYIEGAKRKSQDFMQVYIDGDEDYRYGCCCQDYQKGFEKEFVQFT